MSQAAILADYVTTPLSTGWTMVDEANRAGWVGHGLDDPANWDRYLAASDETGGRGGWARISQGDETWILKRLHRGGVLAPLWRGRFLGAGRLRNNLLLPVVARKRGVATPRIVGVLAREGPATLFRGWLAVAEVRGTMDLARRLAVGQPLEELTRQRIMQAVKKMHDAGIEHRDLNLGNLLLDDHLPPEVTILDLDRAVAHEGPLGALLRRRGLDRLQRSYAKLHALHGSPVDWGIDDWPRLYRESDGSHGS